MVRDRKKVGAYGTDRVARQLFHNMVEDFRNLHGQDFARKQSNAFMGGIREFRDVSWPVLDSISVAHFKAMHQMENLLKKYRFQDDMYTDEQLTERTRKAYVDAQESYVERKAPSTSVHVVLQEARRICKSILGEFNQEELMSNARFGRRASIGCGFQNSYIDYKLSVPKAFTGTTSTSRWFFGTYLPTDQVLGRLVKAIQTKSKRNGMSRGKTRKNVVKFDVGPLKLVEVPKSWKIERPITPLTLLSLFYSYGYGTMVAARLRKRKLDIRKLQAIHRQLAQEFSSTLNGATVDLERASDSIMSWLLNVVLPRPWYNALKKTFSRQIEIGGVLHYTATVLPMGNGATFPVETLVFYCIIKAVGNLLKKGGVYSVYGDDMIYPSSIHSHVVAVFTKCGITINRKKTFVKTPFRESCGGDYYRGSDVRPFILGPGSQALTRGRYLISLYKCYNGLLRRWEECELPNTFRWLQLEILSITSEIHQVPTTYPDTAGVHTKTIRKDPWIPWRQPRYKFEDGSGWYEFTWLYESPLKRVVQAVEPYYWTALSGRSDALLPWETEVELTLRKTALSRLSRNKGRNLLRRKSLEYLSSLSDGESQISWQKVKIWDPSRSRYAKDWQAFVAQKGATRIVDKPGSTSFWA